MPSCEEGAEALSIVKTIYHECFNVIARDLRSHVLLVYSILEMLAATHRFRGSVFEVPWCRQVMVDDVLLTFKAGERTFYGVKGVEAEEDFRWDWPHLENLFWVQEDSEKLSWWQDIHQRPRISESTLPCDIEAILGHYQSSNSIIHVGVKWKGHDCPTWELEDEIADVVFAHGVKFESLWS